MSKAKKKFAMITATKEKVEVIRTGGNSSRIRHIWGAEELIPNSELTLIPTDSPTAENLREEWANAI